MRFFHTAGACVPERHYMVPAAERLPDARRLIDQGGYFVVYAPRQSGRTTALRTLARELLAEGRYAVLHTTCEMSEPAGDDHVRAQRGVLAEIRMRAEQDLPPELRPPPWPSGEDTTLLRLGLRAWAEACPRPLVLFLDEIDALRGEGLRSVLRQLRAGDDGRPQHFPWSVVLCGVRDVRDYTSASGADSSRIDSASRAPRRGHREHAAAARPREAARGVNSLQGAGEVEGLQPSPALLACSPFATAAPRQRSPRRWPGQASDEAPRGRCRS